MKNGGTFITTYFSGIVNEHDLVIPGGYPGKLRDILGIWVEEQDALPEGERNRFFYNNAEYPAEMLCDIMHLEGAKSVSLYEEDFYRGTPVITKNQFGKGTAWYIGTRSNKAFYHKLLTGIFRENGIKGVMQTPEGVEATVRENTNGKFIFLLNHSNEEKDIPMGDNYVEVITGRGIKVGESLRLGGKDVAILKEEK